jgi:hypothetical protein
MTTQEATTLKNNVTAGNKANKGDNVRNSSKEVIAQNSAKAQELLAKQASKKFGKVTPATAKAVASADVVKPEAKKVTKPAKEKSLSNEKLGEKLLREKADEATILNTFVKIYKERGITDKKWIQSRANIYIKIATKKLAKAS